MTYKKTAFNTVSAYLAGPFFIPEDRDTITRVKNLLERYSIDIFSPKDSLNAIKMNAAIKRGEQPSSLLRELVFDDNVFNIKKSSFVLAYTDNFDAGTMFEIGYAFAMGIPVITFSRKGYGLNLMLANSVYFHIQEEQIETFLKALGDGVPENGYPSNMHPAISIIADTVFGSEVNLQEDHT